MSADIQTVDREFAARCCDAWWCALRGEVRVLLFMSGLTSALMAAVRWFRPRWFWPVAVFCGLQLLRCIIPLVTACSPRGGEWTYTIPGSGLAGLFLRR